MIILTTIANTNNLNPEKWTEEDINKWFEKQEWLSGWEVKPDASINKRSLAIQYHKNPQCWNRAFTFLKEVDLNALPNGKQEIIGNQLFVAVDEYNSKNLGDTKYESHKKYLDIQFVISGEEQMGLVPIGEATDELPYDEGKDLMFYNYEGGEYIQANQHNFLIFFPEDVHRPGVKMNESIPIKKVVVKMRME